MTNVKTSWKGTTLIIEVNTVEDHGKSKTGKSTIVGTTHGFTAVARPSDGKQFGVSVNVTKK